MLPHGLTGHFMPFNKTTMKRISNKTIITEFYKNVIRLRKSELIADYVHEDYIQHSPMGKDGREALFEMVEFLKTLPPPDETTQSPIANILAEDDFVVAHLKLQFMGKHIELMELFRVQDGLAAEHWDVTNEPIKFDEPIINASVSINNGLSNKGFIVSLYNKIDNIIIHNLIAEGDQVAVHAEFKSDKSIAMFDIFKLEGDKIIEHNYVKQEVPETMMHTNGMF